MCWLFSTLAKFYDLGSVKVKYLSTFIYDFSKPQLEGAINGKVAYHDPCHLGRHSGVYEEPRYIISDIARLDLVEFRENREKSMCCDAGGGLLSAFEDLAQQVALTS